MPEITNLQLSELVQRTRTVLNAANEAAENGDIPASAADLVEENLAPIFRAASAEQERQASLRTAPEPAPAPAPSRARY